MSIAESPPQVLATYAFRRSVFDSERQYVLLADRIEVWQGNYLALALPLHAIRTVHLRFDPSEVRAYFKCTIRAAGTDIFLRHNSYKGFNEFEDRSATFAPFVLAVLYQLAHYPGVRFRAGSLFNFILSIVLIPFCLGIAWIGVSGGNIIVALIGLGLVGTFCWLLPRYRPRSFDPLSPPGNVLPVVRSGQA